ncbi:hypothetical protein [Halomarina ordinaria]|uniref:Sulfatase-like hydrolase/transferase n=1 Tax=Halomarina ordinaria TaxID=3033939 RepID=A0ABD5UFB6_9EURY|nr:hypothetical protein [Halomarina sp. PSRA2]
MALKESIRYALSEVGAHYDDRRWWKGRLTQRVVVPVHERYPGDGAATHVMDEDWDTLVVLDGCRADLFEAVADLREFDDYRRVESLGSMTAEWTEKNFADGAFGDTVYVSANPFVSKLAGDAFHDVVEVWADAFDEEAGTVPADAVADAAREAHETYPDKRLVVHFMQPHYPFVGYPEMRYRSWSPDRMLNGAEREEGPHDVWEALEDGELPTERVWAAYADNLRYVLAAARALTDDLDGRAVLTSDHGNLLGERVWPLGVRVYGHPRGVRHPDLVRVPWAVLDGERRRTRDDGVRSRSREADDEDVNERLRALGYRE